MTTATIDVSQIPALSVRPPWGQLIIGRWKPCENRTWATTYRGPVIIHASKTWEQVGYDFALSVGVPKWALPSRADCSGYLGVADLTEVHPASECAGGCGVWGDPGEGVFHWVMQAPRAFDVPIPGGGRLGLYRKGIPAEVLEATARLEAA